MKNLWKSILSLKRQTKQEIFLCLVVLVYLFLFINYVNKPDIFNDEGAYYFISRLDITELIGFDVHPPFYPLLIKMFPNNIIMLRWFSSLFGLLSLLLIFKLANLIYDNDDIATISTIILLLNPFFIKFSLSAMPYSLAFALSLLSTYYFYKSIIKQEENRLIHYFIVSLLGLMTHDFIIFLLIAHFIFIVIEIFYTKNKCVDNYVYDNLKNILLIYVAFLFIFLINSIKFFTKPELNFREWSWRIPFGTLVYINSGSIILSIVFMILIFSFFLIKEKKEKDLFSLTMFTFPMLFALIMSMFFNIWHDRYFLFFVPYVIFFLVYISMNIGVPKSMKWIIITIFFIFLYLNFDVYMRDFTQDPLRESLQQIGCNTLFIHTSSFSFLPYEMMGCHNNLLINNVSMYHTPISQTDKLINNLVGFNDYLLVSSNSTKPVGNVVYNNMGLLIQYIK